MIRLRTMQWLDRLLGRLFCKLLARLPAPAATPAAPRRVLFVGLAEMGSALLADPALRHCRDRCGATPYFAIFAHNDASLALTGTVSGEHIFRLRPDNLLTLAKDTLAFRRWARAQGFAAAIDIDPGAHFSALLTHLSAAPVRAGLTQTPPAPRDALYTRTVADSSRIHLAHTLLALTEAALAPLEADRSVRPVAVPATSRELPLLPLNRPAPGAVRLARYKLCSAAPAFDADRHQIVLVNPNLGDPLPQRRWPAEHYSAAIRVVAACRDDVFFFLIGTRSDRTALAALAGEVGIARCAAIGGLFEIAELPALFANCAALVSSDCGLAHFAAVTPLPTVVLFGPETPARYRPLGNASILYADRHCSPCLLPASGRQSRCRDNLCLREITPETVAGELLRCLGESAQAAGSERRRATAR